MHHHIAAAIAKERLADIDRQARLSRTIQEAKPVERRRLRWAELGTSR